MVLLGVPQGCTMGPAVVMRHDVRSIAKERVEAVDVARLGSNYQCRLASDCPSLEEVLLDQCPYTKVVRGKADNRLAEELYCHFVACSGSMVQGSHSDLVPLEQISAKSPELAKELRICSTVISILGRL